MASIDCIPIDKVEELKALFRKEGITTEKLSKMTSAQRRNLFAKAIGEEEAKSTNVLFEKALVSNQKQAMRNWVWKNLYKGKPLYVNMSINQAEAMRNAGVTVKGLKAMNSAQRITKLAEFTDAKIGKELNKRFEIAQRSGNLANWEERVLGTKKIFEDQKLKGAFGKIEALDDLGLLTPKNTEKFMEDLVSSKMGVDITAEQASIISRKTKYVSEAWEKANLDMTWENKENTMDFMIKKKNLQDYVQKLAPASSSEVFTSVGARGSMLYSFRSAVNSLMFQIVPGITRTVVKRIGTAMFVPGDYTTIERIGNAIRSSTKTDFKWMWNQSKMGIEIYRKTSYDISRMTTQDDGSRFFGERFTHTNGPTFKEAQGLREKMGATVRGHARLMSSGLKYAAGGTDTVFSNLQRADTTILLSDIIANAEEAKGKLPKGMTKADRVKELRREAYSFKPNSNEAAYIREAGIQDGHMANFTNNDAWGELAVRFRNTLKLGDYNLGSVIVPFLKIPANALGAGFEASGVGLITGSQDIIKAIRMQSGQEKNSAMAEAINKMIAAAGIFGASLFLTSLILDTDDYIGPYDFRKRSENQLTQSKNAGSSYVRIGKKWYSTRWLGPMALPVNAIMMSRQQKAKGKSALWGYAQGLFWGASQFPGVKEIGEQIEKIDRARAREDFEGMAETMKINVADAFKWMSVRTTTGFFNYDIMGLINETRFDFQGRPIPKRGDSLWPTVSMFFVGANVKPDTSNSITKEADRLLSKGKLPVLTEPTGEKVDKLTEEMGEEKYLERLNSLKQDYAKEIKRIIDTTWYKKLSPEDQKKEWDKVRRKEILNRL
jgi:hypothetical protein